MNSEDRAPHLGFGYLVVLRLSADGMIKDINTGGASPASLLIDSLTLEVTLLVHYIHIFDKSLYFRVVSCPDFLVTEKVLLLTFVLINHKTMTIKTKFILVARDISDEDILCFERALICFRSPI